MQAALLERDVFVTAPTGFGKLLPLCASFFALNCYVPREIKPGSTLDASS